MLIAFLNQTLSHNSHYGNTCQISILFYYIPTITILLSCQFMVHLLSDTVSIRAVDSRTKKHICIKISNPRTVYCFSESIFHSQFVFSMATLVKCQSFSFFIPTINNYSLFMPLYASSSHKNQPPNSFLLIFSLVTLHCLSANGYCYCTHQRCYCYFNGYCYWFHSPQSHYQPTNLNKYEKEVHFSVIVELVMVPITKGNSH